MFSLSTISFRDIVQILVLSYVIYKIYGLFRSTRSAHMVVGLAILFFSFLFFASIFRLEVLSWIIRQLPLYIAFIFIVIFQPEIRQFLAAFGRRLNVFGRSSDIATDYVDGLLDVLRWLTDNGYGALIAIEQEDDVTKHLVGEGKKLDVPFVPSLVKSVFYPGTPLHDGGMILNGKNIKAAGCLFALSENNVERGTRHRAALGLSEVTDAVVIVVSEERKDVSIARSGKLEYGIASGKIGFNKLKELLLSLSRSDKIGKIVSNSIDDVVAEKKENEARNE